jgi:hypothetical protein
VNRRRGHDVSGVGRRRIEHVDRRLSPALRQRVAILGRHPQDGVIQLGEVPVNAVRIAEIQGRDVDGRRDGRAVVVVSSVETNQVGAPAVSRR